MFNQLPPPQYAIHEIENGYLLVVAPDSRIDLRIVTQGIIEMLQGGMNLRGLMQHLSMMQQPPPVQGVQVDDDGVGNAPGSMEDTLEAAGQGIHESLAPFKRLQERTRAQIFLCPSRMDVVKRLSELLGLQIEYGDEDGPDETES